MARHGTILMIVDAHPVHAIVMMLPISIIYDNRMVDDMEDTITVYLTKKLST
jgi:hypothetical protein